MQPLLHGKGQRPATKRSVRGIIVIVARTHLRPAPTITLALLVLAAILTSAIVLLGLSGDPVG
jgi:hypothetical protein